MTRCCIKAIDVIIEHSLSQQGELENNLILATSIYREALELLMLHREPSDEEIENFQSLVDDFFEIWVGMFGSEGVTNYIHMLASSHIYYFLKNTNACTFTHNRDGKHWMEKSKHSFIRVHKEGNTAVVPKIERSHTYIYSIVRLMIRDLFMENERGGLILPRLRKKGIKC